VIGRRQGEPKGSNWASLPAALARPIERKPTRKWHAIRQRDSQDLRIADPSKYFNTLGILADSDRANKISRAKYLDMPKATMPFRLLPLALAAAAQIEAPAIANPFTLDYQGYSYTLDSANDISSGTAATQIRSTSWYDNPGLTKQLAEAVELSLGSNTDPRAGNRQFAPYFYYYFEPGPASNILVNKYASECQFGQEYYAPFTLKNTSCIDKINRFDLGGEYRYGYAYEASPRVPIGAPANIIATGNLTSGSGINVTSNLPSQGGTKLLPQFQGGTLTVSAPATIADNFTLGTPPSNAIDGNGNNATFNGIFTDQSGVRGSITFSNSSPLKQSTITLANRSTYTGTTTINNNTTVQLGVENALPTSTFLFTSGRGTLALAGKDQTIGFLRGTGGIIDLGGTGTLTLEFSGKFPGVSAADFSGDGNLIKSGSFAQSLTGKLDFKGTTTVKQGILILSGTSSSATTVEPGASLAGTGTVSANILNRGVLAPGGDPRAGQSIGTFTINDGTYTQTSTGVLTLEVDGTTSDLLKLTGSSFVTDLAGTVKISGTPTPGIVYTGIEGPSDYQGTSTANADTSSVVVAAGYQFCREDDACFKELTGNPDPDASQLQFAWAPLSKDGKKLPIATTPNKAIDQAIQKGGAISRVVRGSTSPQAPTPGNNNPTLVQTCVANTANPAACKAAIQGPPAQPPNQNISNIGPRLDGGNAAIAAVVNNGVTGGTPIPTASGGSTGYTTKQAQSAGLPSDFVTVLHTFNSLSTRSALISSLHQVTAEPYASMQSVALEAMEQFRFNALALTNSDKAIRLFTDAELCQLADGTTIPADSAQRPADCKPRKLPQASRWSLLIDATNTQANLDGTNNLASLDYNVFQSTYGLQYDASRQWSVGAAFGYGQANLYNYEYANSTINSNTYSGGAWAIYRPSTPWTITGLVGYMNLQYDSDRSIAFGGLDRNATASWSGNGFTTALQAQYDWILSSDKSDRNAVRFKPNTYLAYSLHSQGDITESGADSLNLAIDGHTADSLVYGIGFTLETPIQLASSTRLIPRLSVGYEYDFNGDANEEHQLTASFADVPALGSLDVLGQNRGANDLNVALNVELEASEQFSLYAGVGGSFWSNGNELNYGGGLRWRFGGAPKASIAKAPITEAPVTAPSEQPLPAPQPQTIRGLW
jgi:uncharacterized protein with beta-barrel porin domain